MHAPHKMPARKLTPWTNSELACATVVAPAAWGEPTLAARYY